MEHFWIPEEIMEGLQVYDPLLNQYYQVVHEWGEYIVHSVNDMDDILSIGETAESIANEFNKHRIIHARQV